MEGGRRRFPFPLNPRFLRPSSIVLEHERMQKIGTVVSALDRPDLISISRSHHPVVFAPREKVDRFERSIVEICEVVRGGEGPGRIIEIMRSGNTFPRRLITLHDESGTQAS